MKLTIYWNNHPVEIDTDDRMILIDEQGCKTALLYMTGLHPVWGWNGDKRCPTFSPSILTRIPWGPERREIVNHVFIRDGGISYLSDCTHAYAGKKLELPQLKDWPEDLRLWEE